MLTGCKSPGEVAGVLEAAMVLEEAEVLEAVEVLEAAGGLEAAGVSMVAVSMVAVLVDTVTVQAWVLVDTVGITIHLITTDGKTSNCTIRPCVLPAHMDSTIELI